MRIAIIGSGISGLVVAHRLHAHHDITVFEAADWIGGHTHTLEVNDGERRIAVDTGFIVFNEEHYPNFAALLTELGIASQPTRMSFSVRCDITNTEYSGGSLRGMIAQKRNLLRPRFWRMLRDLTRFHREAATVVAACDDSVSVAEFVRRQGYSDEFVKRFLLPMGASLWSCPPGTFLQFPARFVIEFFRNHRMLQSFGRPTWRVVQGGSQRYVDALTQPFRHRIYTSCPVRQVKRNAAHVLVESCRGSECFDHVVLACHADQTLALLADADELERRTLSAFPYQPNEVILHTDTSLLPRRSAAWSAWNFLIPAGSHAPCATYNMNILQSIESQQTYCVSLNASTLIDPARIIARFTYHHPTYDRRRSSAWSQGEALAFRRRSSFCGAYWGYGFHEDGVVSALRVVKAITSRSSQCASRDHTHSREEVLA